MTAQSRLTSGLPTEEDARCTPTIIVQLVLSCLRLLNVKFSCVHIFILFIIYCNSHRSSYLLAVDISLRLRYLSWGKFPHIFRCLSCPVSGWEITLCHLLVGQPILCHKSFFPFSLVSFSCEHKFGKINLK